MKNYFSRDNIQKLPQLPGVYLYLDKLGNIIYIGKAVNLHKRVCSYFQKKHWDLKTNNLVDKIQNIKIIQVVHEFEAILLEAELIRKHKPKYNLVARDDKHYIYISITDDTFPRILLSRENGNYGPFPTSQVARDLLYTIRSITPYCSQSPRIKTECFYSHLNLCNPCPGYIRQQSGEIYDNLFKLYRQNIRNARILLGGKINKLKATMENAMSNCVKKEDFENAGVYRDRIANLDYLINKYHTASDYIHNPYLMTQTYDIEHKELFNILNKYYTQLKLLNKIECYDISNIQGKNAVGSMVTFIDGHPNKQLYRRFRIKFLNTPNDFEMLKEIFNRRLKHEEWGYPNLIIVDGGKPQLNAMNMIKNKYNLNIPIIGLAKRFDEIVIQNGITYLNIKLPNNSPALHLIQRLRDEAHRFAHSYYEILSRKNMFKMYNMM